MLYLFNTTIMPNEGVFINQKISVDRAQIICNMYSQILATGNFADSEFLGVSAIGHEATAQAMSLLLNVPVPVNRIHAELSEGDQAICLKIRGRLPEGVILTLDQMKEIGYDFFLITRVSVTPQQLSIPKWKEGRFVNDYLDIEVKSKSNWAEVIK